MNDALDGFIRAGTLDELRDRRRLVVGTPGGAVLVAAAGDDVVALDNRCPHMGFPLHRGGIEDGILPATGITPVSICGADPPSTSGRTTSHYARSASLMARYGWRPCRHREQKLSIGGGACTMGLPTILAWSSARHSCSPSTRGGSPSQSSATAAMPWNSARKRSFSSSIRRALARQGRQYVRDNRTRWTQGALFLREQDLSAMAHSQLWRPISRQDQR
jgi:Rieske [2Fe-2S] domain